MKKLSIKDLDLREKRLFMRVDFNVPLNEGRVEDDSRIRASMPTIDYALQRGARLVLASHLGRPKGTRNEKYSLGPVARHLQTFTAGRKVRFAQDCVGAEVEQAAGQLTAGEILVLENLRFHAEEEKNDDRFSAQLARLADLYVNDAFGAAHRAHASTVGVVKVLGRGAAGLLMEREIDYLSLAIQNPERPATAVFGGAKVSDKIETVENFIQIVENILIGGGMAYTFLKAKGKNIGKSLVEDDKLQVAVEVMERARSGGVNFLLPQDHVVAAELKPGIESRVVEEIPDGAIALDIGPKTVELYASIVKQSGTVIWNGPMGVFETTPFERGTVAIARAMAEVHGLTIVGGGDSVAALNAAGVQDRIDHVSTGGGASLEFLAGKKLPGVEVLTDRD